MKKIFTKLTLFALALVAGTQLAMATETEGTLKQVGEGSTLEDVTSAAKWLKFGDNNNADGACVTFEVTIPAGEKVIDAKLLWTYRQYGSENYASTVSYKTAKSADFVSLGQTQAYPGGGSLSKSNKFDVTSTVTEALNAALSEIEGDNSKTFTITFKFNNQGKATLLAQEPEETEDGDVVGGPMLAVNSADDTEITYTVKFVQIVDGKQVALKEDITRSAIGSGTLVSIKDVDKAPFKNSSLTGIYQYDSSLSGNVSSIKLTKDGKNELVVVCRLVQTTAYLLENLKKYPYTTFVNSDYNLDFSNNQFLEAYIAGVHPDNASWIKLTKVNQVPAKLPVILKYTGTDASDDAESSINVNIDVLEDVDLKVPLGTLASANLLKVSDKEMSAAELCNQGTPYVLTTGGFAMVSTDSKGNLAAGKGYIIIPKGTQSRLTLVEDDEATAVAEVEAQAAGAENVIYNMQGVRVQSATAPGLYIINGKKVLVK